MVLDCETAIRALTAHRLSLLAYIRAIGCDEAITEDVYQDVAVLVIQKCGEIADVQHLLAWTRRASRIKALEALRSRRKVGLSLDDRTLDLVELEWKPFESNHPGNLSIWLKQCVDELSSYSLQLIKERFENGLVGQLLAEKMGRERNTVYVALSRIYKKLADCIHHRQALAEAGDE